MPETAPMIDGDGHPHGFPPAGTPRQEAPEPGGGAARAASRPVSVALVGTHGHGTSHLGHVRSLADAGAVRLAAVVDPHPLATAAEVAEGATRGQRLASVDDVPDGTVWHPDLAALLAAGAPDVVILCTPIDTHAPLATAALEAGCDVLLEKPPTASLAELEGLVATQERTGRTVQVGFQTYGSHAVARVREVVASGEIGTVTGVGGVGTWVRPDTYWTRARWAGRRTVDGRAVVDGVVTNPLAHAVATALLLAGASRASDVASVELDLARANPIEADDTSSVRVTTTDGLRVALGLTLCAAVQTPPHLVVHGTEGRVVLHYTRDVLEVTGPGGTRTETCARDDLLENLLAHRADPAVPLHAPLVATGAFMRVLDAVRAAPDPVAIDPAHVDDVTDDAGRHLVVRGVEDLCAQVAETLQTFSELGAPWTRPSTTGGAA
ncbi:Gfo/Idh/MocA family protein [Cellulomonas sp. NS3]|uniref:Gfo/Idh/MocA family protein n=1 Tax=Cellulomonas sp. NS3 TaxID=2973977 RepID=UPI00216327B0|nr:Gfo/Idh/MocA family oxidoreductase [Cellulomonas sp. NS3]